MTRGREKACLPYFLAVTVIGRCAIFVRRKLAKVARGNVIIATSNSVCVVFAFTRVAAIDVIGMSVSGATSRERRRTPFVVAIAKQNFAHLAMTRARAKACVPYCLAADVISRSVTSAWATREAQLNTGQLVLRFVSLARTGTFLL